MQVFKENKKHFEIKKRSCLFNMKWGEVNNVIQIQDLKKKFCKVLLEFDRFQFYQLKIAFEIKLH